MNSKLNFTIQTKSQQKSKTFVCSDDVETKQNHWEIYRMNKQKTVWIWNKWIICFWKFYIKTKWANQIFFYIFEETHARFSFLTDSLTIAWLLFIFFSQFNLKRFEILFLYYLLHIFHTKYWLSSWQNLQQNFFLFFTQHTRKYHNIFPEKMLEEKSLLLSFPTTFSQKKNSNNTHFW